MNRNKGFTPKGNEYIFIRTGPLLLVVLVELIILFTFKDGGGTFLKESGQSVSAFLREQGDVEFLLVGYTRIFIRIGFIAYLIASIAVVFTRIKMSAPLTSFHTLPQFQIGRFTLFINALCFLILLGLPFAFQNPVALLANPYSLTSLIYAFSPIIWMLYLFSVCDLVFPVKGLLSLVAKDWVLFVVVFAVVLIISYPQIYENLINFWSNLLLIPAIELASVFSQGFGLHYQMLPILNDGIPIFGTHQFSVEIAPACSGYEGMTLITLLLGLYCYLQRGSLRMSRALWIFPIAVVMMFLLNGLRIFILVAIGHYWSPEAALNGFHTVGGWLNLLTVWIASLLALNLIPFFQRHTQSKAPLEIGDKALLIPLIVMMMSSLFIKVVSPDFSWFYPISILLTALALFYSRKFLLTLLLKPSLASIAIGVMVFVIWIYLISDDPLQSAHFLEELNTAPVWLALLWLLFRVIGACLIVPIAEECAFRGYIQPTFEGWLEERGFKKMSIFFSLGMTALLFGFVHSSILAGSIAGVFYGLAYLHRGRLMDAVVAHAVTNALLAIYVLSFGYWSYW